MEMIFGCLQFSPSSKKGLKLLLIFWNAQSSASLSIQKVNWQPGKPARCRRLSAGRDAGHPEKTIGYFGGYIECIGDDTVLVSFFAIDLP